jgi:hypothetical protein
MSDRMHDQDELDFGPFIPDTHIDTSPLSAVPTDYPHLPIRPPYVGAWQIDSPDVDANESTDAPKPETGTSRASAPRADRSTLPLASVDPDAESVGGSSTQPLPVIPHVAQTSDGLGDEFEHLWQTPPVTRMWKPAGVEPRRRLTVLGFVFPLPQALGCAILLVVLALCGLGTLKGGLPWLQQTVGRHLARVATATPSATASAGTSMSTASTPPSPGGATPLPGGPTPTIASPTAALDPHAGSATVTFTRTTASKSGAASMTACPSGCPLISKAIDGSQTSTPSLGTTGWNQTSIEGYLQVNNLNQHAESGVVAPYAVLPDQVLLHCQNGGYDNGWGFFVSLPYAGTVTVDCILYGPDQMPPPANFFVQPTTLDNGLPIEVDQPNAFWSNGYQVLTQADCNNAVTQARSQASGWANNDWNAQISGWTAVSGPTTWTDNEYCSPQVGSAVNTAMGHSTGHDSGLGWHPTDAAAVARTRLNAQLDGHFGWTSQSTCTPSVIGVSGTTISLTCGESGIEQYQWSAADTSGLQAKLAGLSLADAQTLCQATVGVSGGCTISLQGGTMLPTNPAAITIIPQ